MDSSPEDDEAREAIGPAAPDSFLGLLQRARAGESAAKEDLMRRCRPALKRWAAHRLPDWARGAIDTDDLVQESLMRTLDRLPDIDFNEETGLHAYLRATVMNRIRDEMRTRHRWPVQHDEDLERRPGPWESPLARVLGAEATERYEAALLRLPTREREAIVLRIEMGLDYREIAEALGWNNANAARMAVVRAAARLAEAMADER